ncbi:class I SAM-dependent methyltransferase [Bacillus massiliigorillae]|uniref:class I SAM-dependent methyltransferase n=1 Tax=Bacillus massiliigorillae TaxID=1243664 RepID=UPI0003A6637B|nr:class I SAM-dependent methyltransferase [Bacillus massiliigorillae]
MINELFKQMRTPEVFKPSEKVFWQDAHIANYLLAAHLDSNFEGASRNPFFIDKSADFITNLVADPQGQKMIDFGCGPGLYCERLYKKGFEVTGVDFSENSILYAKEKAMSQGLPIEYRYENYLQLKDQNQYDMAIFIYCDYGALSKNARRQILQNIWSSLKKGGQLFFDVFTENKYESFSEGKQWSFNEDGGFWSPLPHIELNHNVKYDNYITLEQTVVLNEEMSDVYYIWNQYFTKEMIISEVTEAGFTVKDIFSDVTGKKYSDKSDTLAILLEK